MLDLPALDLPAVWCADDATTLSIAHPDCVVVLDANRRPTTAIPIDDVVPGYRFPVHARAAVVTGPNAHVRFVLATAGISVLDSWPRPSRPATGEDEARLAVVIDSVAEDGEPALIGFGDEEVAVKPLDGLHPATALEGFEVPPSWWAIGVFCTGRILHAPDTPSGRTNRISMRMATAITRNNGEFGWIERNGSGREGGLGPSIGRVPDSLRRALDLPTPPPPAPTDALFAAWWLAELADRRCTKWREAAQLHPATKLHAIAGEALPAEWLIDVARALGRVWGWNDIREQVAAEQTKMARIDAATAAWMDAGMFSREVLSTVPDLATAMARVRKRCSQSVARRAQEVIDELPVAYPAPCAA